MRDGPAAGLAPIMVRCPVFLRVVHDPSRTDGLRAVAGGAGWDVLDLLDDAPRDREAVYVYRRVEHSAAHVCARGRGARSGWTADYVYVGDVDPSQLRERGRWQRYVERVLAPRFAGEQVSYG